MENNPTIAIVGPVRLSYLTVFKPRLNELKNETQYSLVGMIPKKPTTQCPDPVTAGKQITAALKAALVAKFKEAPAKWGNPLRDGDAELNDEGEGRYPGYWFFNCSAKDIYPPVLINAKRETVVEEMGWKSGDWGKIKVSAYAYDFKGKKGAALGLRAVQFLYVDEGFGSNQDSVAVANEFDVVEVADQPTATATDEPYDPFSE